MENGRKKNISPENARIKLEALCARSEQCTFDLYQKLQRWGFDADKSKEILSKLQKTGFVNDQRFARAFVNDKIRFDKWGQQKIFLALRRKNIDSGLVRELLKEVDGDRIDENLSYLLEKKRKTIKDVEPRKVREKLMRFAIGRGYTYDAILRSLNSSEDCD